MYKTSSSAVAATAKRGHSKIQNGSLTRKGASTRVSFNGDLLEVSAVLADAEAVDRLVKALQANKALLPEKKSKDEEAAN
jgi:hypothetical protein